MAAANVSAKLAINGKAISGNGVFVSVVMQ